MSGWPLVSDQLASAQGWVGGSKTPPLCCHCWEHSPGLRPTVRQSSLSLGGWWELARAWLYLQFKRSYSIGAKDEAAATLSVVLSPMAEGLQGHPAHRGILQCRGEGHAGRVHNSDVLRVCSRDELFAIDSPVPKAASYLRAFSCAGLCMLQGR